MIVGNGLLGKAFLDYDNDDLILFASGVSNSLEKNPQQFQREENLVLEYLQNYPEKKFIYFSTCSIYDSSKYDSLYVLHKLHIEEIIKTNAKDFLILRVSNAVGNGGNPNLLMNYLHSNIKGNIPINIFKNATRNLIDVQDIVNLTQILSRKNNRKIINLAYVENFLISEIVEELEKQLAIYVEKNYYNLGESYSIDTSEINFYFKDSDKKTYLKEIINKYYK